jgi:hypothetical protein
MCGEANRQQRHVHDLGIGNFRVLTVTTTGQRIERMVAALKGITDGEGSSMFLFTDAAILKVANFCDFWNFDDSQISRKLILEWDGAVAIPSFRAESRLCHLSRPPAGSWRQYWQG